MKPPIYVRMFLWLGILAMVLDGILIVQLLWDVFTDRGLPNVR
jgi:hypothetical protein